MVIKLNCWGRKPARGSFVKIRNMFVRFLCFVSAALVTVPAVAIEFETGKWQVSMQSVNPVTGQPINETTFECIQNRNFDPAAAMMEDDTCRLVDKQESGNAVSWKMECGGGDIPVFHGEGTFVSQGKTASGEMKMIMNLGGNNMEMRNQWQGKFISPKCDGM